MGNDGIMLVITIILVTSAHLATIATCIYWKIIHKIN